MNLYDESQGAENEDGETISMNYEEYLQLKETFEAQIEVSDAARKLATIPEFELVVMGEYFTKEPARLGALMASGKIPQKSFDNCAANLQSIANFRSFLTEQLERGELARSQLESLEESYEGAVASGVMNPSKMI